MIDERKQWSTQACMIVDKETSNILLKMKREKKLWNLILLCQDHLNQLQFKWISMHVRSNDEWSIWDCCWSLFPFDFNVFLIIIFFHFNEPIKKLISIQRTAVEWIHECRIRFISIILYFLFFSTCKQGASKLMRW